jgi:hypothetical protein
MTRTLQTLALITAVGAALAIGGCQNNNSGPKTGGSISPTPLPAKQTKSSVPKNYAKLKEGAPTISAIVASGGDVDVRDSATNVSIWAGRVKPNSVITVAPDGVSIDGLKKMALKNPRNKHAIYFVKPQQF